MNLITMTIHSELIQWGFWLTQICLKTKTYMAVRRGFEPLIRVNVYTLSRRALSATQTSHRDNAVYFTKNCLFFKHYLENKSEICNVKLQLQLFLPRRKVILKIDLKLAIHHFFLGTQK